MRKIVSILFFTSLLFSCQKVIDVDLNSSNPKIVIEANYSAEDSTIIVKVSETSNYFDASSSPTINSAQISITNQNGISQNIPSIGNGEYLLGNYAPIFNSEYTLNVSLNGNNYTAMCFLPSPTPLKNITYEYVNGFFGIDGGYVCYLNYDDPVDTTNFFIALLSENHVQRDHVYDFILTDDRLTEGNSISRPLFGPDNLFNLNDTVGLELRAVDERIFNYYVELQSIVEGGGGGFSGQSAAPSNPENNWNNDALGYFNAYSNSRKEVIIL